MNFYKYFKESLAKFIYIISIFFIVNLIIYLSYSIHFINEDLLYLNILLFFISLLFITYDFFAWKNRYSSIYNAILNNLDLNNELIDQNTISTKIIWDIIDIKNKEKINDLNKIKKELFDLNDFITLWIHEIKLPLSVLELLSEQLEDLEVFNIANSLRIEIERINFLINQVLYTSRSTDISKDISISPTDLNYLINTVIKENKNSLISKNIAINIEKTNSVIYTDKKWSYFIINQIINNSIKYTNSYGKISIYFEEKNNTLDLIIKDNGIGIAKDDIDRVFEKGFTGKNGVHFQKSTGMGLYLSKKVSNNLNFNIYVDSLTDSYTKFTISFDKMNPYFKVTKM